jgi:hypothetical protein
LKYRLAHSVEDELEVYEFSTPKGQHFEVSILANRDGAYEFTFDSDSNDEGTKSGKGEEFQVFSTVLKILSEFVKDEAPDHFFVESTDSEPSRVKLYRRMISLFVKKNPEYEFAEKKTNSGFIRWDVKVKRK